MEELLLFFIIILIIFLVCNKLKRENEIQRIKSTIDNRIYIVRKLPDSQMAADKLAEINRKILQLISLLKEINDNKEGNDEDDKDKSLGLSKLIKNYNPDKLSETGLNARYTSYSVNKGEDIYICLRDKETNQFIDNNIIMFVVIHELAHVMTKSIGHTKEFWDNMDYLLHKANEINIYEPHDYGDDPQKYCGITINSTPYDFKK